MDVMSWFFSQRKLLYRLMDQDNDQMELEEEEVQVSLHSPRSGFSRPQDYAYPPLLR
jgi:hypothetical protein